MRATLLGRVRELLGRTGYFLNGEGTLRPLCFDVVARRDGQLLLLKVLTNVDGLSEPVAQELRVVAQFLDAVPLVVGERSSSRPLETGAVYVRYGVRIVTIDTLGEYLEQGVAPLVYAAPGGFYVNLDGARLRELREARGLSLGDLAQAAGVSRRAIGMYEEGMGAMVDVAARLEEFLDEALALPTDPFERRSGPMEELPVATEFPATFEGAMLARMRALGFRVAPTQRAPFAAVTRGDEPRVDAKVVLTGFAGVEGDEARRAKATSDLCEVTETWGVFFVERTTTRTAIEGTPVVSREELARIDEPEALVRMLRERRGRTR